MDNVYLNQKASKLPGIIIAAIIILILAGLAAYVIFQGQKRYVSPVPSKPTFELVFYTPTPEFTAPTSTPSATPKLKKPLPTTTIKPTSKPTGKPSISPTPKI